VYQVHTSIPIYFADPNMKRQKGTALNSDAYSSLQLQVDFASDLSTCLSGYNGTVDFSQLHVQWSDERIYAQGDTDVLVQEDHVVFIPNTQPRLQDLAMPSDGVLLQLMLQSETLSSTLQTLTDGLLNKVKITADNVDFEKYAKDIRQQMFDDEWFDAAQTAVGIHFIDFMDGKSQNGLDLRTLAHYFDVNNISTSNNDNFRIYTRRGYRPSSADAPYSPASF
jgi:hypothetical protein